MDSRRGNVGAAASAAIAEGASSEAVSGGGVDNAAPEKLRTSLWQLGKDFVLYAFVYLAIYKGHFIVDAVVSRRPKLEVCTYVLLALIPQVLIRYTRGHEERTLKLIARSVRSPTLKHALLRARRPLQKALEALLWYLSVNFLSFAPPPNFVIETPWLLRFLDSNGDGVITALEIEEMIGGFSINMLMLVLSSLLGWFLIAFKRPPDDLDAMQKRSRNPPGYAEMFWRKIHDREGLWVLLDFALTGGIIALVALEWLNFMGISPSGVWAFGSAGGLAVGLAAKDFVKNAFASMEIFIKEPFLIDDFIEVQGVKGSVRNISWNQIEVETVQGPIVAIPNSVIIRATTTNRTRGRIRLMGFMLPVSFPAAGIDGMNELMAGLRDHVAQLGIVREILSDKPKVSFAGAETLENEPIAKVQLKMKLKNQGPLDTDGIRSQVGIEAVRFLQSQGCRAYGVEAAD